MNIILFDTPARAKFFPLTHTRAVSGLRVGIFSLAEWWQAVTKFPVYSISENYLQELYEPIPAGDSILVEATYIPTPELVSKLMSLQIGEAITSAEGLVAGRMMLENSPAFDHPTANMFEQVGTVSGYQKLNAPTDLFTLNDSFIRTHFSIITKRRSSQPIPETVQVINPSQVFIEEGATLQFSILNASNGPIYIGKNAVVMEGSAIRGPFAMGEGAVVKMGSKIYGSTTLGPHCVAGGELKNSIMMAYSNKAHDGYLGDSVIGEWCNMGAGTSSSNVKNNASEVRVWDYHTNSFIEAGVKCGLIMGDYSRTAINTSINTGTVIGVCCNVFGEGLTPKVIPGFTWGTKGLTRYEFDKAIRDIVNWKRMKNNTLTDIKQKVLKHIFEHYND